MKKLLFTVVVLTVLSVVSGCSEFLDNAPEGNIESDNVVFDFSTIVEKSKVRASNSDVPNTFSTFEDLDITDLGDPRVSDAAETITGTLIERAFVRITAQDNSRHLVKNLTISADDVPGSPWTVESLVIGQELHVADNELGFMHELVWRLISGETVTVNVKGRTDTPENIRINIAIESDIVFTTNPLYNKVK
jgi:hypothetical protein